MRYLVILTLIGLLVTGNSHAQSAGLVGLEKARETVQEDYGLKAYLAVAKEDLSICTNDQCRTTAGDLLQKRYLGEKKCDRGKTDSERKICQALQQNTCATLSDTNDQTICQAILSGDVAAVPSVASAEQRNGSTVLDAVRALAVIAGYRSGLKGCQKYFDAYAKESTPEQRFFVCRMIFSPDPQATLEQVEQALALFELAKADKKYCDQIADPGLYQACTNLSASE